MRKRVPRVALMKKILTFMVLIAIGIGFITGLNYLATNTQQDNTEKTNIIESPQTKTDQDVASGESSSENGRSILSEENREQDLVTQDGAIEKEQKDQQDSTEKSTSKSKEQITSQEKQTQEKSPKDETVNKKENKSKTNEQSGVKNKAVANEEEKQKETVATEEPKEKIVKDTVLITIVGSKDIGTILNTVEVERSESDHVLDILKRVTKENKIQMEYRGMGATAYVEGIQNLYEFDRGSGSGWMYSINGKFPNKSAGIWPVEQGDHIQWLYTENLGKDLGAGVEDGLWDGRD